LENLKQVEKSIGREPKELAGRPRLRIELLPHWELFVDLNNASDGVIGYADICAYSSIYGALTVFEADMVRALDQLHTRQARNG
jgi:hypothetical protein